MFKSVLKLSMVSRNVFKSSKYIIATSFNYSNQKLNDAAIQTVEKENNDIETNLLQFNVELKKIKLDNAINFDYTIGILKSIQRFYVNNEIPLSDLIMNEDFKKVISAINTQIRLLNINQAIALLNVLNTIKIPSSTYIMQSLLQVIRTSLNDLTLNQIYFLTSVLENINDLYLSRSIYFAIQEVFKIKVAKLTDTEDIRDLLKAYIYAYKYVPNKEIIKFLSFELSNNTQPIDISSAVVILLRLTSFQIIFGVSNTKIYRRACNTIINKADKLKIYTVINILRNIERSLNTFGNNDIYNELLIDKLTNTSIMLNYGFYNWLKILKILLNIRHVNKPLLEHLSNYLIENPVLLTKFESRDVMKILEGLAFANYKPQNWIELQNIFLNHIKKLDPSAIMEYFTHLAVLDYYNSDLLKKIFSNFTKFILDDNLSNSYVFYRNVKQLYPEYSGPFPTVEILKMCKNKYIQSFVSYESDFVVFPILEELVGDSDYIKSDVKINEMHDRIDYLIFLQNGYPVKVTFDLEVPTNSTINSLSNIKDLVLPENTKGMAIMQLKHESYTRNLNTVNSSYALKFKILKQLSFEVIPIYEHLWKPMSHKKKLFYLKNLLKLKN